MLGIPAKGFFNLKIMELNLMAKKWVVFNGQKGNQKQIEKIVNQFIHNPQALERMLKERNLL